MSDQESIPRITPQELQQRLQGGDRIAIVDVRSSTAFAQSHLPGAILIPRDALPGPLPPPGEVDAVACY